MPRAKSLSLRRRARTLALQTLYQADSGHQAPEACLGWLLEDSPLPEEGLAFARGLIQGVMAHRREIDSLIQKYAPAWPLEQLSVVDRNILRLALWETLFSDQTPPKAAINEAVELAKGFGSESSPKFVNGVLGSAMEAREGSPVQGSNR